VLLTDQITEWVRTDQAGALSQALAGNTDEMVLSFAQIYPISHHNTKRATFVHGFE
jgi:hypothetical protein